MHGLHTRVAHHIGAEDGPEPAHQRAKIVLVPRGRHAGEVEVGRVELAVGLVLLSEKLTRSPAVL